MNKRIAVLLAILAVPAALLAADVFTEYDIDKDQAKESVFYAVRGGLLQPPSGASNLRKVPVGQRAAVVNTLGAFAKAYFNSEDFKKRYAEAYAADAPQKPVRQGTSDSVMKALSPAMDAQIKMMQEQMGNMPPEMQAQMKEAIEKMKVAQAGKDPGQLEAKQRYQEELAEYNKKMADPKRLPKDPREMLRRRLKAFLTLTADINFDAKLVDSGYRKHFADKQLEARPEEWKMWFRAGREATGAARAFATQWLKELR